MAADARILVTGEIPHFSQGGPGGAPCDAVDLLAAAARMSWDDVVHVPAGNQEQLDRLQAMPRYIASVGLKDVAEALPSATELVVFGEERRGLLHRAQARRIASVLDLAATNNIEVYRFAGAEHFSYAYAAALRIPVGQ